MNDEKQYLEMVLHPDFIEREGAILFAAHLGGESLDKAWGPLLRLDPDKAERTINHIHLSDLSESAAFQQMLGQRIQQIWFETLERSFPEREFSISLTRTTRDGQPEWLLDLWTHRSAKTESQRKSKEALPVREKQRVGTGLVRRVR